MELFEAKVLGDNIGVTSTMKALRNVLEMLNMKEGEFVNKYFPCILVVVKKLRDNTVKMDNVVVIKK